MAGAFEHRGHSFLCREYDRIIVGPVFVLKQALQIIGGVRGQISGLRRRFRRNPGYLFIVREGDCQTVDNCLHDGFAADVIPAVEIGFQHLLIEAREWIRHSDIAKGHACAVFEMGVDSEGNDIFIRK